MYNTILKYFRQNITVVAEAKGYLWWWFQYSGHTMHREGCSQKANVTVTDSRKENPNNVRNSSSHYIIGGMISFGQQPIEVRHKISVRVSPFVSRQS